MIDFDAVFGVREGVVDGEDVGFVDVFAFGRFTEDAEAGAGEGLEGALEFVVVWRNVSNGVFGFQSGEFMYLPRPEKA